MYYKKLNNFLLFHYYLTILKRKCAIYFRISFTGTTTGCTLGILASMYSTMALGITWLRDKEDTTNTFLAATATGLLYKSTAGLRSMGLGAAAGITLAGLYTLVTDNDNIWSKASYIRM